MSEDVARALGAGVTSDLKIKGKVYKLRPLTVKELTEIQRTCLKRYQRQYMETFKNNIDLLADTPDKQQDLLSAELQKVSRWGLDDLPVKEVYDASRVTVTPELKAWLRVNLGASENVLATETKCRQLVTTALDGAVLTPDVCFKLTGTVPSVIKTGYANWWVTGSSEGMIHFVWLSIRSDEVSEQDIENEISGQYESIVLAARDVEKISVPDLGNG